MGVTVSIDVGDLDGIEQQLSAAGRKALMHSIAQELVASTKGRFRTETAPDGVKWPSSKAAARRGGKTLTDSGRLRDSITGRATSRRAIAGTNVRYAAAHQFGLPARNLRPKRKKALYWDGARHPVKRVNLPPLPARPFMGISESDKKLIEGLVQRHLQDS